MKKLLNSYKHYETIFSEEPLCQIIVKDYSIPSSNSIQFIGNYGKKIIMNENHNVKLPMSVNMNDIYVIVIGLSDFDTHDTNDNQSKSMTPYEMIRWRYRQQLQSLLRQVWFITPLYRFMELI